MTLSAVNRTRKSGSPPIVESSENVASSKTAGPYQAKSARATCLLSMPNNREVDLLEADLVVETLADPRILTRFEAFNASRRNNAEPGTADELHRGKESADRHKYFSDHSPSHRQGPS